MAEPSLYRDAIAGKEHVEAGAGCGLWALAQLSAQAARLSQTPGLPLPDATSGCGYWRLRDGKLGEGGSAICNMPPIDPALSRT